MQLMKDAEQRNEAEKKRKEEDKAKGITHLPSHESLEKATTILKENQPVASADMRQRIKQNTQQLWQETYAPKAKHSFTKKLDSVFGLGENTKFQSQARRRQVMAARIAAVAALVTLLLGVLTPFTTTPGGVSGAATGKLGLWLPAAILIIALVGLWVWLRNKD